VAALCGQHCLNNLLQGPYFSEVSLAEIAQVSRPHSSRAFGLAIRSRTSA
jgi:hypothetical protein